MTGTLNGIGNSIGSTAGKVGDSIGSAASKAKIPAIAGTAAAAGLAGGVLGSRALSSRKSGIGVGGGRMLKSVVDEVGQVGKEIGKAGFRLGVGDLDMQVQSGRGRKGRRDSPVEVLLKGLTSRSR
jgi:hypothetical protein